MEGVLTIEVFEEQRGMVGEIKPQGNRVTQRC